MLNAVIRSALNHRMAVLAASLALAVYGAVQVTRLPIDVFPDLDRPRVTIIADAPGMAPEDIEALVTIPLETALHGAPGAVEIRSSSGVGLSAVYVEFDWGSDPYLNRQIVAERLSMLADRLPPGVVPQLAPLSSIMGQIQVVALISRDDRTSPMELRTLADWTVRPRLASVSGIAQVIVMGGERRQLQALVNPNSLVRYGVTLAEVETALAESNQDASGGYLEQSGANEYLVRSLGRIRSLSELADVVVASRGGQAITLSQIARLVEGPPPQRGDGSAWTRDAIGAWQGGPAVVLTIHKQPSADTRAVTRQVRQVLAELQGALPADVQVLPELYQQSDFIDLAVDNVLEALRDGVLLVAIVLALFLMNVRTTLITLTAIPLSILATAVVFAWWGLSINTMTLGGLAVAVGELVDDAIVDVENIFRRLRQNQQRAQPWNPLRVVYEASVEIRSSIVFSTLLVVLAFAPLMALSGLEGQLFRPLALAYITSLVASLAVSLTVTPVLSYRLLVHAPIVAHDADSSLLRMLKGVAERVIRFSLRQPRLVLGATASAAAASVALLTQLDRDFLPAFNEGAVQVNVVLPPGTSLAQSKQVATQVEHQLAGVPDVISLVRRTGRAELDEHAEGVNSSELIARIDPDSPRSRTEIVDELSAAATSVPGAPISVEQPLAHLISHMLSGVKAQVAVKVFGEDLDVLRREARRVRDAIADVPGVRDLHVEPQIA
ncbi:MAG TPA: efflux RND transporter permease subunit, partial [Lacipirellulaceae bacterium]|nr:efflux RND transporter permease subunit [Lacipirellulaceae bacterium]